MTRASRHRWPARAQVGEAGSAKSQPLRFIPIDERAKDGGFHLLRALRGPDRLTAEYCGRWNAATSQWELSCGCEIEDRVTSWATTLPELAPTREMEGVC